jgi:hypothetical protein
MNLQHHEDLTSNTIPSNFLVHNPVGLSSLGDVGKENKHVHIKIRHAVMLMLIHNLGMIVTTEYLVT